MEWHKEKQRQYPSLGSGTVYLKNNEGEWVDSEFTWQQVDNYLKNAGKFDGVRGLADLKKKWFGQHRGLPFKPSEEEIVQWMEWHKEKQGQYPSQRSGNVYLKNDDEKWVDSGFTWQKVYNYLNKANFDGVKGLADFKQKWFGQHRGLPFKPSEEEIVQWMEWHKEKQGQYPSQRSGNVYLKNDDEKWVDSGFTWEQVKDYLKNSNFDSVKGLADLKRKHGESLTMSENIKMTCGRG